MFAQELAKQLATKHATVTPWYWGIRTWIKYRCSGRGAKEEQGRRVRCRFVQGPTLSYAVPRAGLCRLQDAIHCPLARKVDPHALFPPT